MIQKIKAMVLTLATIALFALPVLAPTFVFAQSIEANLCQGAELKLTPVPGQNAQCAIPEQTNNFQNTLNRIVNIISLIVGVVAVIMIIFGGFRYITSGGASEKVTNAKNTILYGLIGLVIVALAQVIVRFVLRETSNAV